MTLSLRRSAPRWHAIALAVIGPVLASVLGAGCVATPEREGVGGYCHRDNQCLEHLQCVELTCREETLPGEDAGIDAFVPPVDAALDAGSDATVAPMGSGIDGGPPDGGPPDAGPPDGGPPDAGPPDGGPPDAGPPDGGPLDARTSDARADAGADGGP